MGIRIDEFCVEKYSCSLSEYIYYVKGLTEDNIVLCRFSNFYIYRSLFINCCVYFICRYVDGCYKYILNG